MLTFVFCALFQWITIPFAMKHEHVSSITTTQSEWIGTFDTSRTGEWMDYAMHLVRLRHFLAAKSFSKKLSIIDTAKNKRSRLI